MKSFLNLAKALISCSLMFLLLLGLGGALTAVAQINPPGVGNPPEITTNDPYLPLVYTVENTGAGYPAPTFPAFEYLPIVRPLPDPFVYLSNGQRDTSFAGWAQHRAEIMAAFDKYMVGPKPDCNDCTINASYTTTSANHYTLTITIARAGQPTLTMTSAIVTPAGTPPASGWPYVIGVGGATGSLPASIFPGVATVVFNASQITTSSNNNATGANPDPFFKLYSDKGWCVFNCSFLPSNGTPYNGTVGQFQAWSWGISRLIDGVQTIATQATNPLPLDTTHSAITGCSINGKIALYGGVMDERIALTISQENGGGGVPSWRYSYNADAEYNLGTYHGSVEDIDTTDHHWWAAGIMQYQFSGPNVYKLPIDLHEIAALIAPRALVELGNTNSYWLGNGSNYVSARAIQKVYNTLGIGNRFGFIVDGNHAHCSAPAATTAQVAKFVNRFLLGQNVSTDVQVYPAGQPTDGYGTSQNPKHYYPTNFSTMDYQRWTSWWGTNDPQFRNSWNTGGTTDLWFNNPVTLNTGDTVQAGLAIQMPVGSHPAATVKLNNANIQTDVTCSDGSSYVLYIPLAKQTYTIAAGDNTWYPSDDPTNAATYQGSASVAPLKYPPLGSVYNQGCANGQPGQATRTYLVSLGQQDNSNGDPAGPGFATTDTTKSPLVVRFHLADTTSGDGGGWGPAITVNQLPTN
jgi:hypothetical protein